MPSQIRRTEYFYTTVKDEPGDAYKLLSLLAEVGVNLLAFTAVPIGPLHTQLTLFPADPPKLTHAAKDAGFVLDGPHLAFIVSGDDELGALADIHSELYRANVNRWKRLRGAGSSQRVPLREAPGNDELLDLVHPLPTMRTDVSR